MNRFGKVTENAELKNYNTYHINSRVKYLIEPYKDKLEELILYLNTNNIKYLVLGGGSNIILADSYYDGVFIKLTNFNNYELDGNTLVADAGVNLSLLVKKMCENGFNCYDNLYGIPGSLGGAIWGNAGANGTEIFDYLESVTILIDNKIKILYKDVIEYGYRNTFFKKNNYIILSATFKLENDSNKSYEDVIKNNLLKRKNNQPLEYPNAGSVFKNPINNSAGRLIEECGLKGLRVNDAMISNKHANFIVNMGEATGEDILNLISLVKNKVKEKYKIDLELEQKIIKW